MAMTAYERCNVEALAPRKSSVAPAGVFQRAFLAEKPAIFGEGLRFAT